jgi:hypothetical protein
MLIGSDAMAQPADRVIKERYVHSRRPAGKKSAKFGL